MNNEFNKSGDIRCAIGPYDGFRPGIGGVGCSSAKIWDFGGRKPPFQRFRHRRTFLPIFSNKFRKFEKKIEYFEIFEKKMAKKCN